MFAKLKLGRIRRRLRRSLQSDPHQPPGWEDWLERAQEMADLHEAADPAWLVHAAFWSDIPLSSPSSGPVVQGPRWRMPRCALFFPLLGALVGSSLLATPAAARTRGRRARRHARVGMLLRPLPPTWTRSTLGREVVLDAEPEHVPPPIAIRSFRAKLTRRACFRALRRRHIQFAPGPNKGGLIAFPVVVRGKIGGVYYQNKYSHAPMLADCQLVLALYRAAAVFRRHSIVRVLWSNTWRKPFWSFKLKRSMPARGRRVGNHPRGLAMDASVLVDRKGRKYVVQPDWEKLYGGPGNCVDHPRTRKGLLLRRLICDLEKHHIFRRILTPDSNWQHRHHFHFTAPRVNEAFVRSRWCGRTLNQPLPGTRSFKRWNRWYSCYKIRHASRRWRCYKRHARGRPQAPVHYRRPRQKPKVALRLVIPSPSAEPDVGSRSVNLRPRSGHSTGHRNGHRSPIGHGSTRSPIGHGSTSSSGPARPR